MADQDTTTIDVEFNVNTAGLEKGLDKAHKQAQKTAKTQTTQEKASTAAQKEAARVAGTTRKTSERSEKKHRDLSKKERVESTKYRKDELKHEAKVSKSFKERIKYAVQERNLKRQNLQYTQRQIHTNRRLQQTNPGGGGPGGRGRGPGGLGPGGGGGPGGTTPWWRRPFGGGPGVAGNPGGGAGGGAGGPGDSGGGSPLFKKLVGGLQGMALGALGGVVDIFTEQLSAGLNAYKEQQKIAAGLVGMGGASSISALGTPAALRRSQLMGYSGIDTYRQAGAVARATGHLGATNTAQEYSRISGAGIDEVTSLMGTLTRGGQRFNAEGGGAGRRQMAMLFTDAVSSGLDKSRTGEHLAAVSSIVGDVGGRTAGDVNASGISGLLSWLGRSGLSGFQGERGASFLSGVDQGFRTGGSGEAAESIAMQAMGFGYGGSEDVSYVEARRRMQRGIFGKGGIENLKNLMSTTSSLTGGGEQQLLMMESSKLFGNATLDQLADFTDEYNKMAATGDFSGLENKISELKAAEKDVNERIIDAQNDSTLKVVRQIAELEDRSIDQGSKIYDSVADMQNLMNRLVDVAMPSVIKAGNAIASGISYIADQMGYGGTSQRLTSEIVGLEGRAAEIDNLTGTAREEAIESLRTDIRNQRLAIKNESPQGSGTITAQEHANLNSRLARIEQPWVEEAQRREEEAQRARAAARTAGLPGLTQNVPGGTTAYAPAPANSTQVFVTVQPSNQPSQARAHQSAVTNGNPNQP